jgi:hypothetical protein
MIDHKAVLTEIRLNEVGLMAAKYVNENCLNEFLELRQQINLQTDRAGMPKGHVPKVLNAALLHALGVAATIGFFKEIEPFLDKESSRARWCLARATEAVCDRWKLALESNYLQGKADKMDSLLQESIQFEIERMKLRKKKKAAAMARQKVKLNPTLVQTTSRRRMKKKKTRR